MPSPAPSTPQASASSAISTYVAMPLKLKPLPDCCAEKTAMIDGGRAAAGKTPGDPEPDLPFCARIS